MTVGIARLRLFLPQSHSLKDKRMVLRRIKDRVRNKFNVSIAEVDDNDVWQRSALGVVLLGQGRAFVEGALDEVVRFVCGEVEVTNVEREIQTYNASEAFGADDMGFRVV